MGVVRRHVQTTSAVAAHGMLVTSQSIVTLRWKMVFLYESMDMLHIDVDMPHLHLIIVIPEHHISGFP